MARQARVEYPGALHHVFSRGNRREPIFLDDTDRLKFLELLGEAVRLYGWLIAAWVLMTNHFHLMVETPQPNLSDGMRWLLGTYATWFNKRHEVDGHLFGERFGSNPVEQDVYGRRLLRYIVRNPVRAGLAVRPEDYPWSSYRATAGLERAPEWLNIGYLVPFFGSESTWSSNYIEFVHDRLADEDEIWKELRNQIYLGSETWVASLRKQLDAEKLSDVHPQAQRCVGRPQMPKIVASVAQVFGMTTAELRNTRGGVARQVVAWLGRYEGMQHLRAIARWLRIRSCGRVTELVRECEQTLQSDRALREMVDLVFATLDNLSRGPADYAAPARISSAAYVSEPRSSAGSCM